MYIPHQISDQYRLTSSSCVPIPYRSCQGHPRYLEGFRFEVPAGSGLSIFISGDEYH
jgi:hypothetical protein